MIKQYVKRIIAVGLLGVSTLASSAPVAGEWTVQLWDDVTGIKINTWNICIQGDSNWYISTNRPGWKGKWFSKGNDVHMQAIHPGFGATNSFDLSIISSKNMAGYYKTLTNTGKTGYYTTFLAYKSATCPPYVPYIP